MKMVRTGLGMQKDDILIPFSAETKQGRDEIWALIEQRLAPVEEVAEAAEEDTVEE